MLPSESGMPVTPSIKIKNKTGPSTEPWGTPENSVRGLSIDTNKLVPVTAVGNPFQHVVVDIAIYPYVFCSMTTSDSAVSEMSTSDINIVLYSWNHRGP